MSKSNERPTRSYDPSMSNEFDNPSPAAKVFNTSGFRPVGRAVLTLPFEDRQPDSRIVLPPTVGERATMLQDLVTVLAIGGEAWTDERVPRARVGDLVYIPTMAGRMVRGRADDKWYRVINDKDIFGVADDTNHALSK